MATIGPVLPAIKAVHALFRLIVRCGFRSQAGFVALLVRAGIVAQFKPALEAALSAWIVRDPGAARQWIMNHGNDSVVAAAEHALDE